MKTKLTDFDIRIWFNEEDLPIGIVWITCEMRKHLLQYGDIMFLDAQKDNTISFVSLTSDQLLKQAKKKSVLLQK